jgi:hypothetical protein
MASNKAHVIDRSFTDRRFTVVDVAMPGEVLGVEEGERYFQELVAEIRGDGPGALLSFLMSRRYHKNTLRRPILTEAAQRQSFLSMSPAIQFWTRTLDSGRLEVGEENQHGLPPLADKMQWHEPGAWPKWVSKTAFVDAFLRSRGPQNRVSSVEFWIEFYRSSGLENVSRRRRVGTGGRHNTIELPPLDECIDRLCVHYPGAVAKGDVDGEDEGSTEVSSEF